RDAHAGGERHRRRVGRPHPQAGPACPARVVVGGGAPGAGSLTAMKVAGAQLNLTVGDLEGNEARIGEAMDWAEAAGADVLLVSEWAVTGYPPEDLVLRASFVTANKERSE